LRAGGRNANDFIHAKLQTHRSGYCLADAWDQDGDGRPDAVDNDGDGEPDEL